MVVMRKINNPQDLWSDSFINKGKVSISVDPNTNEFDSHCEKMLHLSCIVAYYDENGKLHLVFDTNSGDGDV